MLIGAFVSLMAAVLSWWYGLNYGSQWAWVTGAVSGTSLFVMFITAWCFKNLDLSGFDSSFKTAKTRLDDLSDAVDSADEVLKSLNRRVTELDALLSDVHLGLSADLGTVGSDLSASIHEVADKFIADISGEIQGLSEQVAGDVLSMQWRSLPFSNHFASFSTRTKALYFDAISTGDWSKFLAHMRQKNEG